MNKNPLDSMDRFVPLLDVREPSFTRVVEHRQRRRRRRQVMASTGAAATLAGFVAAMVWVLPFGTGEQPDARTLAAADRVAAAAATTDPALGPAQQAPVEFTACNVRPATAEITVGREETVRIPTPDGEMTIERGRGHVVPQVMSDVSDPRLDGTWVFTWNEDGYRDPQGRASANIVTSTWRIETDEGAWQGTETRVRFPDDDSLPSHLVLPGEGAYEGLTAVWVYLDGPCPNIRGYIIDGSVPEDEATLPTP